jgi:galactokinase
MVNSQSTDHSHDSREAFADRFAVAFSAHYDIWRAPGRINLIGEHVDYCGGPVMPGAIEHATRVSVAPTGSRRLRVVTPFGSDEIVLDRFVKVGGWQDYVAGMAFALSDAGFEDALSGHDLIIESTVPTGVGVSSSAALEVAVGLALGSGKVDGINIAAIAQQAENTYVGMPCGIMDQVASACGRAGQLMLLDCATLQMTYLPFPANARLVLIDSGVEHSHATGSYRERREDCEAAARQLGVDALAQVESVSALTALSGNPLRRARHVVSEIARTGKAHEALLAGDLGTIGELMNQSHASLSHDMEVSTPEVDQLAALAQSTPGVFGARMMGGGFGGSVIALVGADIAAEVCAMLKASWSQATGKAVTAFEATIGAGAGQVART